MRLVYSFFIAKGRGEDTTTDRKSVDPERFEVRGAPLDGADLLFVFWAGAYDGMPRVSCLLVN